MHNCRILKLLNKYSLEYDHEEIYEVFYAACDGFGSDPVTCHISIFFRSAQEINNNYT